MVSLGREGYIEHARGIFETVVRHAGRRARRIPSCAIIGEPSFCFSFTSDEFDIYHVNDFMRTEAGGSTGSSTPTRSTWR